MVFNIKIMAYSNELIKISKIGVDARTIADTIIGITENGTQNFYPLFAVYHISSATSLTVAPSTSIGTNAGTSNNLLAASALTGMTVINKVLRKDITLAVSRIAANTPIYVRVTTVAIATVCLFDIHLFGYYA